MMNQPSVFFVALLALVTTLWPAAAQAQSTADKRAGAYESIYLVAGVRDAQDRAVVVAADFNRTQREGGVVFEYKAWVGRGADWQMVLYEQARAADGSGWPALGGASVRVAGDLALEIHLPTAGGGVVLTTQTPAFHFVENKDGLGQARTAHVPARVELGGRSHAVVAAYEHVLYDHAPGRDNAQEAGKQARRVDPHSHYGLFDWVLLWDDHGRLWQVSAGNLTQDFGYRVAGQGPQETGGVSIQWLATERDDRAGQDVPTRWLIDVPAWGSRFRLHTTGQHVGHGDPRPDGARPVYRQIGVDAVGSVGGERLRLFGMVESIVD